MTEEGGFDGGLLRRDPAAFFGLGEGFDAKDLRRAYHAAIRRFRPETHPEEFQLLREAHERLAAWLTFGGGRGGPAPAAEPSRPGPSSRPVDTPARRAEAYRELARDPGDPADFTALALLADAVPGADRDFEAWLLEGLARHPGDDGLDSLLRIYQQEDLPAPEVPRFLRRVATALPPRLPWTVAAYSWETAALRLPFEEFLALWEQCRSPGDDIDEGPRAALLAYLLPLLAPAADPEWLRETLAWLGERHDLLPDGGAGIDAVEAWLPIREAAEAGRLPSPDGPVGAAVLGLLRALLGSGCRDGGERLSRAAEEVAGRSQGVLAAFDRPDGETAKALGRFIRWADHLAARHPSFDPARERKEEIKVVFAVHRQADAALRRRMATFLWKASSYTGLRFLDTFAAVLCGILLFIVFIAGVIGVVHGWQGTVDRAFLRGLVGAVEILGALAAAYFLYRRPWTFWTRRQERLTAAAGQRAYARHVRPVVVEAVRDLGLPPEVLVDPEVVAEEDLNSLVAHGVATDRALPILRLAHRFAP